jgi:hypothetical protein
MGWAGRLLLVVVALTLVATPAFVYPNGGVPAYEYQVEQQEVYHVQEYADWTEYVDCARPGSAPTDGSCALARYARDDGGIVVEDADLDLPQAVALADDGVVRSYWVTTTETDAGTRVTVSAVEELERLYELVATPVDELPRPARAALQGRPTTVAQERPPGEHGYLVRYDGGWRSVDRVTVRDGDVPLLAGLFKRIAPPVGGLVLGLAVTGWRAR